MNKFKNINFKQKKYILPLILLPFILFFSVSIGSLLAKEEEVVEIVEEINTSMSSSTITSDLTDKKDAYSDFYNTRRVEGRSKIESLEEEVEEKEVLGSNYNEMQKRYIDSIDHIRTLEREELARLRNLEKELIEKENQKYEQEALSDAELLRMLSGNNQHNDKSNSSGTISEDELQKREREEEMALMEETQMRLMKEQMFFLDSLEKANDPIARKRMEVEKKLKEQKEEHERFMNSRLKVTKEINREAFNTIYKEEKNEFIKAVIDEDIKGYLGSRIRIRLLEDIYVGNQIIKKGTFLYAQISGFTLQRVELSIVSIMYRNEILPIKLDIYDNDGMKGLYVPQSTFREITRELGGTAVQGQQLSLDNGSFIENTAGKLFQSTSRAISNLIRKNKAKLKYNTFIYLIDESNL